MRVARLARTVTTAGGGTADGGCASTAPLFRQSGLFVSEARGGTTAAARRPLAMLGRTPAAASSHGVVKQPCGPRRGFATATDSGGATSPAPGATTAWRSDALAPDEADVAERPGRIQDPKLDRAAPPPPKHMTEASEFQDVHDEAQRAVYNEDELPLWLRYTTEDLERAGVGVDMFGRPVIAADRPESWQFAPRGSDATRQRFALRRESDSAPVAPPRIFRSKFALTYLLPAIARVSGWGSQKARQQMMTRRLVNKFRAHADRDEVLDLFYLPDTFQSWFSVNIVHLWMVLVRLRKIQDPALQKIPQLFFDHFWRDVETECLEQSRISNPFVLGKHMRYIEKQYYGCVISYDEGLIDDDCKLAEAFWRNIYHMQVVDARRLNEIVRYVRRELAHLDEMSDQELFSQSDIFRAPDTYVSLEPETVLDGGITLREHIKRIQAQSDQSVEEGDMSP